MVLHTELYDVGAGRHAAVVRSRSQRGRAQPDLARVPASVLNVSPLPALSDFDAWGPTGSAMDPEAASKVGTVQGGASL